MTGTKGPHYLQRNKCVLSGQNASLKKQKCHNIEVAFSHFFQFYILYFLLLDAVHANEVCLSLKAWFALRTSAGGDV